MKKLVIFVVVVALLAFGGYTAYNYIFHDLSGMTSAEIVKFQEEHPYAKVSFTVTVEGSEEALTIDENTFSVQLKDAVQLENMVAQADYLQHLTTIDLGEVSVSGNELNALQNAFPSCELNFAYVVILDQSYPVDTTEVNLSGITSEEIEGISEVLALLPNLTDIYLMREDGTSSVSLDEAVQLNASYPNAKLHYSFELFGQVLSTDMETVEYFKAEIGDAGLDVFRKIQPMMYNLNYLKLDWCNTTDEATAALREEFAEYGVKVVWRVFFKNFNALTDTYKIWANWSLRDADVEVLKYCNEVKYLDLGHNQFHYVDFVSYMPDLEVAILAITPIKDITPLANCTKLTYLELLATHITDISVLENLTELEYLNLSHMRFEDLTPIYGLNKLKKLNATMNWRLVLEEDKKQINEYQALHPEVVCTFSAKGDPTDFQWRFDTSGNRVPRYALLCEQFGYDRWDNSMYPKGYLREEITYESTGITPPQ